MAYHSACGILVPRPGIEPTAMKVWSPNHWTAREFPGGGILEMVADVSVGQKFSESPRWELKNTDRTQDT